jgi:hypothetical protein
LTDVHSFCLLPIEEVLSLKSFNRLLEGEVARLRGELNAVDDGASGSLIESGAGERSMKRGREASNPEENANDTDGSDIENRPKRSRREI